MKTKTKRKICVAVAIVAIFYVLFYAGGVERERIGMTAGFVRMAAGTLVWFCALYKGGYVRRRKRR